MAAEATGEKRCSRCGKDVSGRSRAKDAQGNYICAECLDKARTRSQTPRQRQPGGGAVAMAGGGTVGAAALQAPDGGADDLMSKLVQDSIEEGKQGCPNCRASMKANQRLCVKCGYDREKGSALHTKIEKPVVVKEQGAGLKITGLQQWIVTGVAALILLGLYIPAISDPSNSDMVLGYLGYTGVVFLIVAIWCAFEAFEEGNYFIGGFMGAAMMKGLFLRRSVIGKGLAVIVLVLCIAYWAFFESSSELLKLLALVAFLGMGLVFTIPQDAILAAIESAAR